MATTDDSIKDLDLSFVLIDEPEDGRPQKIKQTDVLDMSFLEPQQQEAPDERGFIQKTGDFFTGADRQTEAIEGLPEFDVPISKAFTRPGDTFKTALGLLTTFDPKDQLAIIKRNFPEVEIEQVDEKGNVILDASAIGGGRGVMNVPGVSLNDLTQAGFQVTSFAPAGFAARAGGGLLSNAAKVGAASAATQGVQDVAAQASGRDEEVSLGNVRLGDVATAGLAGGGVQALFQGLQPVIPWIKETIKNKGVTEEIRQTVREAAVKLGMKADDITDNVIEGMVRDAAQAVTPEEALALQGEKEFGIRMSTGQRSLDDAQLSFEDQARVGLRGEKAQRVMRGFEKEQLADVATARDALEQQVGGGRQPISSQGQAGALVKEEVRQAERTADEAVQAAYAEVGEAYLKPEGFLQLVNATKKAAEGIDFPDSKALTPAARELKKALDTAQKTMGRKTDVVMGTKLTPVHIQRVDQVRKAINAYANAAANPTDLRNITVMKNAFDDYLDDAVKNALFEGDDASLSALKKARGMFSEYVNKFRRRPQKTKSGGTIADKEGALVEKIIQSDPTDEQVANAVFGASGLSNAAGAHMARRFKNILGQDSEGWQAIRQAAFRRLVKENTINGQPLVSGQKTMTALNNAIEKNGALMKELFSMDEIATMKRFAAAVKRTQPDLVRSRENPSGTAQVAGKAVANLANRIGLALAGAGEPLLFVTSKGVEVAKRVRSGAQAEAAVRPFSRSRPKPLAVAAGTAAAGAAAQ